MSMLKNINSILMAVTSDTSQMRPGTVTLDIFNSEKHDIDIDLLMQKCDLRKYSNALKLALNENIYFGRASKLINDAYIQDPKQYHRPPIDKNGINYQEFYIDSNPLWSKFPKRYHSIMMTVASDYRIDDYTNGFYGRNNHYVFPENGATVALAPSSDFISSFSNKDIGIYGNLYIFNSRLYDFCRYLDKSFEPMFDSNDEFVLKLNGLSDKLKQKLNNIDESDRDVLYKNFNYIAEYFKLSNAEKLINVILNKKFVELIYGAFDPEYFDFSTFKLDGISHNIPYKVEAWTDGTCLLIGMCGIKIINDLREKLTDSGII